MAATLPFRPSANPESSAERIKLPGFGLSLKQMPEKTTKDQDVLKDNAPGSIRLPHAIADWCGSSGVTVYERNMLGFISQITDKPNWDDKVFDEGILEKWRQEATTQYTDFTNSMFDYVSYSPLSTPEDRKGPPLI